MGGKALTMGSNEKRVFEGWLDVRYEETALYPTAEAMERGNIYSLDERLYEMLEPFDGKRVRITVEVLDEQMDAQPSTHLRSHYLGSDEKAHRITEENLRKKPPKPPAKA